MQFCAVLIYDGASQVMRAGEGDKKMRWSDGITDLSDEIEQTLGDSEGQGTLACCSPWGCKESDMTQGLKSNNHPGGSVVKDLPANAGATGDTGSIPGSGRPCGGGNGNPLQYPCWDNPMDRGTWTPTVQGVAKNRTQLSNRACMPKILVILEDALKSRKK